MKGLYNPLFAYQANKVQDLKDGGFLTEVMHAVVLLCAQAFFLTRETFLPLHHRGGGGEGEGWWILLDTPPMGTSRPYEGGCGCVSGWVWVGGRVGGCVCLPTFSLHARPATAFPLMLLPNLSVLAPTGFFSRRFFSPLRLSSHSTGLNPFPLRLMISNGPTGGLGGSTVLKGVAQYRVQPHPLFLPVVPANTRASKGSAADQQRGPRGAPVCRGGRGRPVGALSPPTGETLVSPTIGAIGALVPKSTSICSCIYASICN